MSDDVTPPTPTAVVRELWASMQRRDWDATATVLSPELTVWYPATDERFVGDAFLAMNRAYPEGWSIDVVEVIGQGDRVAARVRVDQGGERFWCCGFYEVRGGRVVDAVEAWVTEGSEPAPDWRARFQAPG